MESIVIHEPDYKTYLRFCMKHRRRLDSAEVTFIEGIKSVAALRERDLEELCFIYARLESAMSKAKDF